MKLYETLLTQLKKEPNYVSDNGEVKKWVIADKARNYDSELLSLLLGNSDLRQTFFKEIQNTTIFLLEDFLLFIEQKNYLNDSYTQYKNKIGLTIGGKLLNQRSEAELVWPYKDCILEGGQTKEDQKRPEIFFNQTLAQDEITQLLDPKVLTGYKRYGKFPDDELFHRDAELNEKRGLPKDTITDNLVIKGNNLLALHSLKKEFAGKVKLIYIDPPYNTDNDSFGYNDSFNHSTWLTFMKNRLEVSKTLLKDDGIIFIHIDDIEEAYLKILSDEIFGRNNFVKTIAVRSSTPSGTKTAHKDKTIIKQKDMILVYKKTDNIALNAQYVKRKKWDTHYSLILKKQPNGNYCFIKLVDELVRLNILSKGQKLDDIDIDNKAFKQYYLSNMNSICRLQSHKNKEAEKASRALKDQVYEDIKDDNIVGLYYNGQVITPLSQGIKKVYHNQKFVDDLGVLLCDFWDDIDFQNTQNEGNVSFPTGKKPEMLLYRIINMTTQTNDIVLDFFGGSGSTAAVAHKMGRQYITCEQLNSQIELIDTRLQNVVDGEDQSGISKAIDWNPQKPTLEDSANGRYAHNNYIYVELKMFNQTFIEQIEEAKDSNALLQIWEQMKEKSFIAYNIDIKTQDANIEDFKKLDLEQQKHVLCEILDKNQLYVNVSDMNDSRFETTDEERNVTNAFYSKKIASYG